MTHVYPHIHCTHTRLRAGVHQTATHTHTDIPGCFLQDSREDILQLTFLSQGISNDGRAHLQLTDLQQLRTEKAIQQGGGSSWMTRISSGLYRHGNVAFSCPTSGGDNAGPGRKSQLLLQTCLVRWRSHLPSYVPQFLPL